MNKLKLILFGVLICIFIPLSIYAASIWTGKEVYYPDKSGILWEVNAQSIEKVTNPGDVYSISDLSEYSAYITNQVELIGNKIEHSLYWYNKSRLTYVKLIKVKPGQAVSFLFSAEKYVCCAEYDSSYTLLRDGEWLTTGDTLTVTESTEWLVMIFRNATGDLSAGAGQEYEITTSDIQDLTHKYLILEPFTYTFNLNGGSYNGNNNSFTKERLGVTKMTLPAPTRSGYTFLGWKASDGQVYNTEIPVEYNQALFTDAVMEAVWNPVEASSVTLNKTDIVLEENSEESVTLTANVFPSNSLDRSVTWTSSNPDIATVSNTGVVKPLKAGKTTITATTVNGMSASCMVYVMGFQVSLPEYCSLNESYEIKVDIFYNGDSSSEGRKHVLLETDDSVELVRVGDVDTTCQVLAETSVAYGGDYSQVNNNGCIVNTTESVSVFYRLKSAEEIHKNGDYEGSVTFNVSVQ